MSNFAEDLILGERFEQFVIKILKKHHNLGLSKNTDKMGVDLISEAGTYEVKYDKLFRNTGNFFIEYLYRGERSGILKYKADFFVYGDENNFWVFDRQELFTWVLAFGRKLKGGDNSYSTAMLIKYEDLIPIAIYKYKRK